MTTSLAHGRGAWTKAGMPDNASTPYYQLWTPKNIGGESGRGTAYICAAYGVRAIQKLCNFFGQAPPLIVDGELGPATSAGIRTLQRKLAIGADGQFGPGSAKAGFMHLVSASAQRYGVPVNLAAGTINFESGWDPGAQGYDTPGDLGMVQINSLVFGPNTAANYSLEQIFDPFFACDYLCKRLADALRSFGGNQKIAVASYNDPAGAEQWYKTGTAPRQSLVDYANRITSYQV